MLIRFLQSCESEHPDFPFMAGQVISVAALSRLLKSHIAAGRAEPVKADDERAEAPAVTIPEVKRRGRRAVSA